MTAHLKPRITLPSPIRPGEVIEVKTQVTHPMETGDRRDASGAPVPRRIINRITCAYDGRPVFEAKLEPAVAANPSLSFFLRAAGSGMLEFAWFEDDGTVHRASQPIKVG